MSVNDIPDATPNSYFKVCIFFFPWCFSFAVIFVIGMIEESCLQIGVSYIFRLQMRSP